LFGGAVSALFGSFSLGFSGYAMIAIQVLAIALLIAATSRQTVNRTLQSID
jgi:hypothetical protein